MSTPTYKPRPFHQSLYMGGSVLNIGSLAASFMGMAQSDPTQTALATGGIVLGLGMMSLARLKSVTSKEDHQSVNQAIQAISVAQAEPSATPKLDPSIEPPDVHKAFVENKSIAAKKVKTGALVFGGALLTAYAAPLLIDMPQVWATAIQYTFGLAAGLGMVGVQWKSKEEKAANQIQEHVENVSARLLDGKSQSAIVTPKEVAPKKINIKL